jgi:hypothetical protein
MIEYSIPGTATGVATGLDELTVLIAILHVPLSNESLVFGASEEHVVRTGCCELGCEPLTKRPVSLGS